MKTVVIVGGGVGGLFTGAFLSKNGYRVTVLEKNAIVGGGLQCFRRSGKIYETGMHVTGGFEPGGNLYRITRYLGIYDNLDLHHIPAECMDEIYYHKSGETYRIASGKDGFVESMAGYFPEEKDGIRAYVDEIYRISEEVNLFYLRASDDDIVVHSPKFFRPADELISEYVSDPRLREVLAYLNPLYGGVQGHTPAYIHALINVLYINGASRFRGGSQQLADSLKRVVEEGGGEVLVNAEVKKINVADRVVTSVELVDGRSFTADWYVSAIHPLALVDVLSEGAFLRGYVRRLNEIPLSYSAFTLFIDLKDGMLPYIDHTCYYLEDYGRIWNQTECHDDNWPLGFMYMTPPEKNQGKYAERMLVHCVMDWKDVEQWKDSTVGHRGPDYEQWKKYKVEKVISKLEIIFPGFHNMIRNVYSASPLTIRDYFRTRNGAIFGYRKDALNILQSQLQVYTKVKNLLLTGQNINLHGMCGVPLTAIITAEAILGRNFIIDRINEVD